MSDRVQPRRALSAAGRTQGDDEAGRDAHDAEADAGQVLTGPVLPRADVHEQDSERDDRRPCVEDEDRVPVAVTEVEHPVVQVLAVGRER